MFFKLDKIFINLDKVAYIKKTNPAKDYYCVKIGFSGIEDDYTAHSHNTAEDRDRMFEEIKSGIELYNKIKYKDLESLLRGDNHELIAED